MGNLPKIDLNVTKPKKIEGHRWGVSSVVFSPDGKLLASGSGDYTVRIWQVDTGECIKILKGHTTNVDTIAFSPDGKFLIAGVRNGEIWIWNIENNKCLKSFRPHRSYVTFVSFFPDGRFFVSGSRDKKIYIWDFRTGKCFKMFEEKDEVYSVMFSPNGKLLAWGSSDYTVKIWDIKKRNYIKSLKGHEAGVQSIAFSPDGILLASGSNDNTIRIWDIEREKCLKVLEGHEGPIYSVAFSPDGRFLASGSEDCTVRIWKAGSWECIKTLKEHKRGIRSVAFSPDGKMLASGARDNIIYIWNIKIEKDFEEIEEDKTYNFCISSGMKFFDSKSSTTGQNQDIKIKKFKVLKGHEDWIFSVAFSSNGKFLASGSEDWTVRIWDIEKGEIPKKIKEHEGSIYSVAFSLDNRLLASGSADCTIRIWCIETGKLLKVFKEHEKSVYSVAFSPDGRFLASGSADCTVRIWSVETGECLKILKEHEGSVHSVAFSPDGKLLASGSGDTTVCIWEVETGKCLEIVSEAESHVYSVAFSSDGKFLALGSKDKTIYIWDITIKDCVKILKAHIDSVYSVAFSPDGRFLASGSADCTVRIWSVETGECLKILKEHEGSVHSVAFSPDGKLLASGSKDKIVYIWERTSICMGYYAKTPLQIKKIDGTVVSLPPGTFLKYSKNKIIFPIKGDLIWGEMEALYENFTHYLVIKSCPLKPFPEYEYSIQDIPIGTILDKKQVYLTKDKKIVYVKFQGLKGFITSDAIVTLEPIEKLFAFSDAKEKLRFVPNGECIGDVPLGAILKSFYYCPYFDAYFVEAPTGKGWIFAKALKELYFKLENRDFVALKNTPIKIAYFVDTNVGYVAEGEEVKGIFKLKNEPYYYVETKAGIKGYISEDSLKSVKEVEPVRLWVNSPAKLFQAPIEGATPIGDIPQSAEVKPIKLAESFYYVKVLETEKEGWIGSKFLTDIKPNLYEPVIKIVDKKQVENEFIITGIVVDDTEVSGVYANGLPVPDLESIESSEIEIQLPFKPEDVKKFTYRIYLPKGYPFYEITFQAVDRGQKIGVVKIRIP